MQPQISKIISLQHISCSTLKLPYSYRNTVQHYHLSKKYMLPYKLHSKTFIK